MPAQERADHIAEWVRLKDEKVAQLGPPPGGVQPKEQGFRKAAREIGVTRQVAQRAVKIASITPEARRAADEAGLHTQKARLQIAPTPDFGWSLRRASYQQPAGIRFVQETARP